MVKEAEIDETAHFGLYEKGRYIPRAAGELGEETKAILKMFDVKEPEVVKDVRTQVFDLEIKQMHFISPKASMKEALSLLEENKDNTILVCEDEKLVGLVAYKDIAREYMDLTDDVTLGNTRVPLSNVEEVLGGRLLVRGREDFTLGKEINIMAANIQLADKTIKKDNIVILSYDKEKLAYLLDKKVDLIVLCDADKYTDEIEAVGNGKDINIISSSHSVYDSARLIKQAMCVDSFMVDKEDILLFMEDDFVDDVVEVVKESNFRDFPVLSKEGKVIGAIDKASLLSKTGKKIVMVDHNEKGQAVLGIHQCEVIEIIDHHKLSTVETNKPLNVTTTPVGCTATIVFSMYENANIEVPKDIAGVLCGAILSDTMNFKSPTCTEEDVRACKKLASICGRETDDIWDSMLEASLDLSKKTDKDILYQDYKKFSSAGFSFGLGQVLVSGEKALEELVDRIIPYMKEEFAEESVDLMGLLITDVKRDGSELVFFGDGARGIIESAFKKKLGENRVFLEGVVSRKKQIVPQILTVLGQ